MSIQLDHSVDLNSQRILDWIKAKDGTNLEEIPDDQDLVASGLKFVVDSERSVPQTYIEDHMTANHRHYIVLQEDQQSGRQIVIGGFKVQVPVSHQIEIGLQSILYVARSGLSPAEEQAIVNAYGNFQMGKDPLSYLVEEANRAGISTDMFYVAVRYTMRLIGSTPWEDQVKALEKLYRGGASVEGDHEWFQKNRIVLKLVFEDEGHQLETPAKDPLKEQDAQGNNPDDIVDAIADKIAGELNCDDYYVKRTHPVMTVLAWPEYMVEWYPHIVKVGCTRVKIWLPKLRIRIAEVVLYATVAVAKREADATLMKIISDCAIASAVVGAVVGVVLANFLAAEAAFVALFQRCILIKVGQHSTCMVPALALITVKGTWS